LTLGLCNITVKLPSKGRCSWGPENRSVAPKWAEGIVWETLAYPLPKSANYSQ